LHKLPPKVWHPKLIYLATPGIKPRPSRRHSLTLKMNAECHHQVSKTAGLVTEHHTTAELNLFI